VHRTLTLDEAAPLDGRELTHIGDVATQLSRTPHPAEQLHREIDCPWPSGALLRASTCVRAAPGAPRARTRPRASFNVKTTGKGYMYLLCNFVISIFVIITVIGISTLK
jgi:hypothetical protein